MTRSPGLIEDALDAIEYAIGPVSSKWGALRAKHGHPAPFPLKYIEIGNEQRGERYGAARGDVLQGDQGEVPAAQDRAELVDRRASTSASSTPPARSTSSTSTPTRRCTGGSRTSTASRSYKRQGWDLYIGEFATNAGVGRGNVLAMLNDAAYMMSMEKNTDLVKMGSYAPLLENVNDRDWPVNMIHFDSSRAYARATYYANKLFAENLPTVNLTDRRATTGRPRQSPSPAASASPPTTPPPNSRTSSSSAAARRVPVRLHARRRLDAGGQARPLVGRRRRLSAGRSRVAWSFIPRNRRRRLHRLTQGAEALRREGFIIPSVIADGRRVQWNIGGWGNTPTRRPGADAVVGEQVRGTIEAGRWYDIKIEVRDRTVRGYLDGQLVQEQTLPRIDKVLAISGRDDKTGDIIVKVVNSAPEAAAMTIEIDGGPGRRRASVTVLTSDESARREHVRSTNQDRAEDGENTSELDRASSIGSQPIPCRSSD